MGETYAESPAVPAAPRVTRWRAKRAAEVDAVHWDGAVSTATAIIGWMLASGGTARYHDGPSALSIDTVDGTRVAVPGDWIARYPAQRTFRPFTEDQFAAQYEPAAGAMAQAELRAELVGLRDRAEFYEAERDRHRLGEEHYREQLAEALVERDGATSVLDRIRDVYRGARFGGWSEAGVKVREILLREFGDGDGEEPEGQR
jgi:hypothetical protein